MTRPADRATSEAHADGEQGKPTARDATGAKQEGFKDDGDEEADDEESAEARKRRRERDHLRKQAGSSLP